MGSNRDDKRLRHREEVRRKKARRETQGLAEGHAAVALEEYRAGRHGAALLACEKALRIDPAYGRGHVVRAFLLRKQVPREAASELAKAFDCGEPFDTEAVFDLIQDLELRGEPDAALVLIDRIPKDLLAQLPPVVTQLVRSITTHGRKVQRARQANGRDRAAGKPASMAASMAAGNGAATFVTTPRAAVPALAAASLVAAPSAALPSASLASVALAPATPPPIDVTFDFDLSAIATALAHSSFDDPVDHVLRIEAEELALFDGFQALLALDHVQGVTQFRHQIEAVRRALRDLRGRALLADEVGLGKTVEACLILKEYLLRSLVESVLILVPAALVGQWREELATKFGLDFATSEDAAYRSDPAAFLASQKRLLLSIDAARHPRNRELLIARAFDLIVVDEAHRLRHRASAAWKLVDSLRSRHLLLLTATPIQNDLMELYNLVTLLKPGHLKTAAQFRRDYVVRGDPTSPRQREKLRELLGEVMIRNTRANVDVRLPPRRAETIRLPPSRGERELYAGISALVRAQVQTQLRAGNGLDRLTLQILQREAASSPDAVGMTLGRLLASGRLAGEVAQQVERLAAQAAALSSSSKADALAALARRGHKLVVFTAFRATQTYLARRLDREGLAHVAFHGDLDGAAKDAAIDRFRGECGILLATEAGGEGRNLQFADALCNFDLPWNPMRIEQRIGRIHRIGQTRPVTIYNLSAEGTVEDHLLDVLDRKINLFELVVGELDLILGELTDEREFAEQVFDAWSGSADDATAAAALARLGEQLAAARASYDQARALDEALFAEEFES